MAHIHKKICLSICIHPQMIHAYTKGKKSAMEVNKAFTLN